MIKQILFGLALALAFISAPAIASDPVQKTMLLRAATATGAGTAMPGVRGRKYYQLHGKTTAGAGSAVGVIQGTMDELVWEDIGTITLTLGTTVTADGFSSEDSFAAVRVNLTTLTGTGAQATAIRGD